MYSQQIDRINKQLLSDNIENSLLPIPENLMALRRLCHRLDSSIYDVELAVAKEPAFATYILKLGNSALYSTGKAASINLLSVIQRIGMHSVSQYALTFVLKNLHEQQFVSPDIAALLQENWRLAWDLSQQATQLYTQHRLSGSANVKKIDISDILLLGILQHTGRLAVLSDFSLQYQCGFSHREEEMSKRADLLNTRLLPLLFKHCGLPVNYAQLFTTVPDHKQPLHAMDYLFAAALLKAQEESQEKTAHYNLLLDNFNQAAIVKIAERLSHLQIITMEALNLESLPFTDL
ncbi:HDOD domain-containing protein [Psychromonas sp. MME1]|uniref:HDOD domain-containing protein n=2 Tax=unclassified Psychromonas TaxID=2614957 RepID=UPI0034E207B4